MASAPIITFRDKDTQSQLTSLSYAQSTLGTDFLPVMQGESSDIIYFRVYNNYGLSTGIASAFNVNVTVYDGSGSASKTATKSPVSQSWVRVYETSFGENSSPPGLKTVWGGSDTAIGGSPAGSNVYYPEVSSAGALGSEIRAGTDTNGTGFIEFATYVEIPDSVAMADWSFALSVSYEWVI